MIKQAATRRRQPKTAFIAIANRCAALRPAQRAQQITAADTKALGAEIVRHTLRGNGLQTPLDILAIANFPQDQGKLVALQRAEAQLAFMPRVLQHLATFQLKLAQIGHLFARKPGTQPLFGHGMFIFLPGKTHFTRMDFKELSQRISHKPRIAVRFQNPYQQMLAFAIRRKAKIFDHHEIFRVGFQYPLPLRFTMQPGEVIESDHG